MLFASRPLAIEIAATKAQSPPAWTGPGGLSLVVIL
jgi:hypothetical protein